MTTIPDEREKSARREPPGGRVLAELAGMSPAYFGMVMATGIVSLGADLLSMLSALLASHIGQPYKLGLAAWTAALAEFAFDLLRRLRVFRR